MKLSGVIPPESVLKLIKADKRTPLWKRKIGLLCRIGFYSEQDGLDVVWIVDESGRYCETINQAMIHEYFEVINLSKQNDLYGEAALPIQAIRFPTQEWLWSCPTPPTASLPPRTGHGPMTP
jgi:hypothetical protein